MLDINEERCDGVQIAINSIHISTSFRVPSIAMLHNTTLAVDRMREGDLESEHPFRRGDGIGSVSLDGFTDRQRQRFECRFSPTVAAHVISGRSASSERLVDYATEGW